MAPFHEVNTCFPLLNKGTVKYEMCPCTKSVDNHSRKLKDNVSYEAILDEYYKRFCPSKYSELCICSLNKAVHREVQTKLI